MEFTIVKQSKKSRARAGIFKTEHGVVETPCLVPVATQAAVKTLTSEQIYETNTKILIANTFHLHLKPGERIVEKAGGLHSFMNWHKPLMTDSGGFQVFSLGFGSDLGVGKVTKYFPGRNSNVVVIKKGTQPKNIKITDEGVEFISPLDGKKLFLGPKESIRIQEALGADIMFAFDECTAPFSSHAYVRDAVRRTHRWAKICLESKHSRQALFGIIQGSKYEALRKESARFIGSLPFDGFGIGGDLGETKKMMKNIIRWSIPSLDPRKPRHLLGIGRIEDIEMIIKEGIDMFDCTVPAHYGRHGVAFTSKGTLKMWQARFLKEKSPPDSACDCIVCKNYSRAYICHLIRAKEITGMSLLTFHNIYFFNNFIYHIREKIKNGKL